MHRMVWIECVVFIIVVINDICCSSVQVPFMVKGLVERDNENDTSIQQKDDTPCVCGRGARKRIVGGEDVSIDTFPWMVAVLWTTGDLVCGGAIINHFYILSAAHCYVSGVNPQDIMVEVGSNDIHKPSFDPFAVNKIIMHEKYGVTTRVDSDIALLKLSREIEFGEKMQPICLTPPNEDYMGLMGTVAGWGTIAFGGDQSDNLREANVPVIEDKYCKEKFTFHYTENMFCAGYLNGTKDACQGDSGGPIFIQDESDVYRVFGIVSYGRGCALKSYPGVYTKLSNFVDWVKQKTKDVEQCIPPTEPTEPPITDEPTPTTEEPTPPTEEPPTCGVSNMQFSKRIVGGFTVEANQYPWTALIIKKENRGFTMQCGATLISEEWLITTARCVESYSNSVDMLLAILGEHDIQKYEGTEVQQFISEIWVHPNYDPTAKFTHDIALVRLLAPVKLTREISPICLPPDSWHNADLTGIEGVASGWGWLTDRPPTDATVEQEVFLNITTQKQCGRWYGRVPNYIMCAVSDRFHEGICYYDFGGQFSITSEENMFHLVGVSSFVSNAGCARGYPSGFMRVTYYLPWIFEVANLKFS